MFRNRKSTLSRAGLLAALVVSAVLACALDSSAEPAAQPPAAGGLPPGWEEVDQRMVFLTVQLSTVESSLEATNKALKVAGYKQVVQQAAADKAREGNDKMDRQGGGPVPWQQFYGRTAERFFYRPRDPNTITITINSTPVTPRPPQFDYIYRANENDRRRAEAEAARIGTKIEDLLDYRRKQEAEQSTLWGKIAFRGVSTLELSSRPLYRLDLTGGTGDSAQESLEAAKAAVAFMRAADAELTEAQKAATDDQAAMLEKLHKATAMARAALQKKLLALPTLAAGLADAQSPIGQFSRLAKRLEDSSQNMVDAQRLALECDARDDQAGRLSYRGQYQQMVFDYAAAMMTADQALTKATTDWKITPSTSKSAPPDAAAANGDAIAAQLEAAKALHQKEVTAARRALVAAIDTRLNAAVDAGELTTVQTMQTVKTRAARDGTIPEDMKDPAVLAAKDQMTKSIAAADATLADAYREAIKSYTRARKISEAQVIQDEFNTSGLASAKREGGSSGSSGGDSSSGSTSSTRTPSSSGGASGSGFTPPQLGNEPVEVALPGPVDAIRVGGGGRYLILQIKKLQQLAIFDVSEMKVVKAIPVPSGDVVFAASAKKLFIGLKDQRKIQRWDLAKQTLEQTASAPEGGVEEMAAGADSNGPLVVVNGKAKRLWLVKSATLTAEPYPSKHWGTDGSAGGPHNVAVSFDGSTVAIWGGGWAGIEVSNLIGEKATEPSEGGYVHGDVQVAGNGSLIFAEGSGVYRSDAKTKVTGVEGQPFPAVDPAFSLSLLKEKGKDKSQLLVFSNADPKPLITLRGLPELGGKDFKLPINERVFLIPRGKVLAMLAPSGDKLVLRKFNLAEELEAEGVDYLFVDSSPPSNIGFGARYTYKMSVLSKKGGVKFELQSGPKGMVVTKDGQVSWYAPTRTDDPNVMVVIKVSDSSGQTIFHNFAIRIGEAARGR